MSPSWMSRARDVAFWVNSMMAERATAGLEGEGAQELLGVPPRREHLRHTHAGCAVPRPQSTAVPAESPTHGDAAGASRETDGCGTASQCGPGALRPHKMTRRAPSPPRGGAERRQSWGVTWHPVGPAPSCSEPGGRVSARTSGG